MADEQNHEHQQLVTRLVTAADAISNPAAIGLERDLRAAAEIIKGIDRPTQPLVSLLTSELARVANHTSDQDTQRRLRKLIGEA